MHSTQTVISVGMPWGTFKLIAIPLIFILLRMWSALTSYYYIYSSTHIKPPEALDYLSVSMHSQKLYEYICVQLFIDSNSFL